MSNIVLNATHIACDHFYIQQLYNSRCTVELHKSKIMFSPDNQFCLATYGDVDVQSFNEKEWLDSLRFIIACMIEWEKNSTRSSHYKLPQFEGSEVLLPFLFGIHVETLLVTKDHRFIVRYHTELKQHYAQICDTNASIGVGACLAMGMLDGNLPIPDIYAKLNRWCRVVSKECSIFSLDVLEPFTSPDILKDIAA